MQTKDKGLVIWFTGLPASGKSTISLALEQELNKRGLRTFILDGDKIRRGLCADLGFSAEDRKENIRRISEVAKLFCQAGVIAVVAFISPYREDRDRVRSILPAEKFIEVFIDCPLSECEKRDPKGMYKKARTGEIQHFTGISDPYEAPINPEIHLKTNSRTVAQCVDEIINYLNFNCSVIASDRRERGNLPEKIASSPKAPRNDTK